MAGFINTVKKQFGFTPTSRACLEYQESLFIAGRQTNYIEVIFYIIM
jgi:hypothetical protein